MYRRVGGGQMLRKRRYTEAEISAKLAEANTLVAEGRTQDSIAQALGISVMTFHRWRKTRSLARKSTNNGAVKTATLIPSARPSEPERRSRYAELQLENTRLRKLVTDLLLEKMRLEDEWQHDAHRVAGQRR